MIPEKIMKFGVITINSKNALISRLRALSGGHEGGSPPPQSKKIDYKLADYRYGREEMLALVTNNPKPPAGMDTDETIVHGKAREPLSLESLTEEEAVS